MVDIKTYGMSRCVINFLYSMGDMGYQGLQKTRETTPTTYNPINTPNMHPIDIPIRI